ncbi:COG4315 family predicted lipoprotein [Yoonia maritima]|uniref:COG4315 family predicted lipoprotein n=1 Tax=Yoonia maritima TaxID=1435347 RepID=UPI000D0F408B|nr:hypothetical protein [Yoonia maritima]
MKTTIVTLMVIEGLIASGAYAAGPETPPATVAGGLLTDANGMSLYTFAPDSATSSECNGSCSNSWPPLTADVDAGETGAFTIITRDDGQLQWVYAGRPLYRWVNDKMPGDTTGDGIGGNWHLARP